MMIPHTHPFDWSSIARRAGSLAASIRTDSIDGCQVGLLGVPDDTGVALNGGRIGAAEGPSAFRAALARYGSSIDAFTDLDLATIGVFDAGDVDVAGDSIHDTHERVEQAVGAILDADLIPIVIGGGHDGTLPGVTALAQRTRLQGRTLAGFNIDPHLDMREEVGSGMTFRRLLSGAIAGAVVPAPFSTVGLGRYSNSKDHLEWARRRSTGLLVFDGDESGLLKAFDDLVAKSYRDASNVFASFDLDVLDASVAPGVSALNPMGLSVATGSLICQKLGRIENLRYFDLMELNPQHDVQELTARVAVHLFLSFLVGVLERGEPR